MMDRLSSEIQSSGSGRPVVPRDYMIVLGGNHSHNQIAQLGLEIASIDRPTKHGRKQMVGAPIFEYLPDDDKSHTFARLAYQFFGVLD